MAHDHEPATGHGGNGATPPPPKDPASASDGPPPSPFDNLEALKLDTAQSLLLATSKPLIHLQVRGPKKTEFVQAHPSDDYALDATIFDDRDGDGMAYFVVPSLTRFVETATRSVFLVLAQNSLGAHFLWPVSQASGSWGDSARTCVAMARTRWIRIISDRANSSYQPLPAEGDLPSPIWREETFGTLLKVAFKGRVIDNLNHPIILRSVRGVQT